MNAYPHRPTLADAPYWADFHVFNADGSGAYFEFHPKIEYEGVEWVVSQPGRTQSSGLPKLPNADWKVSLLRRDNEARLWHRATIFRQDNRYAKVARYVRDSEGNTYDITEMPRP